MASPRPVPGERVACLDRAGQEVCKGKVVKVIDAKALNRCAVVTVAMPKRYWNRVRSIRLSQRGAR